MIGLSLADLIFEVFCFAATPSFRGVATIVSKARQAVKDASSSSPELARDRSDLGKRVTDALTTKVKAAREQSLDRGIDTSLLAQAETAVAALLSTDADQDLIVLSAVRDPEGFVAFFMTRAAKHRQQIDEQAEPYFDVLVRAVAAAYVDIAPWSDSFVVVALKSLLTECSDIKEQLNDNHNENRQLLSQILEVVESLATAIKELAQHSLSSTPSRIFFGSRPDVVVGDRFVERDEQKHLHKLIVDPTRRLTVLVGMRGCGKTQLAASLAKQCEDANWSLVAWINASSPESIKSDLVELAKEYRIETSDAPSPEDIVNRLFTRLKSAVHSDRLIVFDNVENIDNLKGLVPETGGLRFVATTTNNTGWDGKGWGAIKVGVFDRRKSIKYLLTTTRSTDRDAADTLARRLGDLPLALAQAAATALNEDWTLTQYLRLLEKHRSEQVIRSIPGDEYPHDVYGALRMAIRGTLNNLDEGTRRAARRQLGALALLAASGVPTHWLDPMSEEPNDAEFHDHGRAADEDAHIALTKLVRRSIVQQSADKATTMLHRLQARAFRESWSKEERKQACESAANLLGSVNIAKFRRTDTESRRREARSLIEQFHAIGDQKHSLNLRTNEQVTSALSQTLTHARDLGLVRESVTLEEFAKEIEHVLGPNDLRVLNVQEELAYMIMHAGRSSEAINMYERILDARTKMQGSDHHDTLKTQQNLAYAYYYQGDEYDKAIKLLEHVYTTRQQLRGDDDVDTLMAGSYLALVYHADGRLQEAMSLYEQVIADPTRLIGADHEHTLVTRNNLAYAYALQGLLPKAIDQYEQVLSARTRTLGALDRQTLMTRSDLALAYALNGELAEAVGRYESVLKDCANALGTQHPLTVDVRESLEAARRELAEQEESSHTEERVED